MARMIDADAMLAELKPITYEMEHTSVLISDMSKIMRKWVERQPTLTQPNEGGKDKNVPTNEPLTLEELWLCNDPVWIKRIAGQDLSSDGWAIVEGPRCSMWFNGIPLSWEIRVWWPGSEVADYPQPEDYGKIWFAYRRPPEGEGGDVGRG